MKKIFLMIIISAVCFSKTNAQDVSISFQNFYDQLSPYGTWVEYPNEGYVWSPNAGADFRPYGSRGHWVYTDEGWTWASGYAWGWAPFHYGRWIYDDDRGWLWVPGYDWAPAWVTWGSYNGNYGWAPLGIDFRADYVGYRPPSTWWLFVGGAYITSTSWHSHVYGGWNPRPRVTVINNTTIINNNVTVINNIHNSPRGGGAWARGPQSNDVQRYTHTTIRPVAISNASRPGATNVSGNRLNIYRPAINRETTNNAKPARAENFDRFRPSARPANNAATRPAGTNVNPQPNATNANGNARPNSGPRANNAAENPTNANRTRPDNNVIPNKTPPVNPATTNRTRPDNNNRPVQPNQPQRHQPVSTPPNAVRPAPVRNNTTPRLQHNNQPPPQRQPTVRPPVQQRQPAPRPNPQQRPPVQRQQPAPRPVNPQPRPVNPQPRPPVQHNNPAPPPPERKHGR